MASYLYIYKIHFYLNFYFENFIYNIFDHLFYYLNYILYDNCFISFNVDYSNFLQLYSGILLDYNLFYNHYLNFYFFVTTLVLFLKNWKNDYFYIF